MSATTLQFTVGEVPDYGTALTLANLLRLAYTVADRAHGAAALPHFAPSPLPLLAALEQLQHRAEDFARSSEAWELQMADFRRRIADGCQHAECGEPLVAHTRAGEWDYMRPDAEGIARRWYGRFSHGCPEGNADADGRPLTFEPLPARKS